MTKLAQSLRKQWIVSCVVLSIPSATLSLAQEREMIIPVPESAYSQAVKVRGGSLLFISGIGPADEAGRLVAPGDIAGQIRQTWDNLRYVLEKAGGTVDDVVTMTVYTTERRWGRVFTEMRKDVFKKGYPSSAFVEARKLRTPGALIEIQAIAVIKD